MANIQVLENEGWKKIDQRKGWVVLHDYFLFLGGGSWQIGSYYSFRISYLYLKFPKLTKGRDQSNIEVALISKDHRCKGTAILHIFYERPPSIVFC